MICTAKVSLITTSVSCCFGCHPVWAKKNENEQLCHAFPFEKAHFGISPTMLLIFSIIHNRIKIDRCNLGHIPFATGEATGRFLSALIGEGFIVL